MEQTMLHALELRSDFRTENLAPSMRLALRSNCSKLALRYPADIIGARMGSHGAQLVLTQRPHSAKLAPR